MAAYLIVEAVVADRKKFAEYARRVPELVARFGGEYVVLGGEQEVLEGDWGGQRVVMHRWPNMASARDFWNSPDYARVRKLREGAGEFRVMLVEGRESEALE